MSSFNVEGEILLPMWDLLWEKYGSVWDKKDILRKIKFEFLSSSWCIALKSVWLVQKQELFLYQLRNFGWICTNLSYLQLNSCELSYENFITLHILAFTWTSYQNSTKRYLTFCLYRTQISRILHVLEKS